MRQQNNGAVWIRLAIFPGSHQTDGTPGTPVLGEDHAGCAHAQPVHDKCVHGGYSESRTRDANEHVYVLGMNLIHFHSLPDGSSSQIDRCFHVLLICRMEVSRLKNFFGRKEDMTGSDSASV